MGRMTMSVLYSMPRAQRGCRGGPDLGRQCREVQLQEFVPGVGTSLRQGEVYRARFRTRIRKRGESFQKLGQNLNNMAHRVYPSAPPTPDLLLVLLRDLNSPRPKTQEKQAKPASLQKTLPRAIELESIVKSNWLNSSNYSSSGFKALEGAMDHTDIFRGPCCHCKRVGHKKNDFFRMKRGQEEDIR